MKKINVKSFEYERDFIEVYSKENPTGQINLLVDWRQHQININLLSLIYESCQSNIFRFSAVINNKKLKSCL